MTLSMVGSHVNVLGSSLRFRNLLVVIKQTAFEEYSQLKLRGQAPKALRWKRLEQRYKAHKQCVTDLLAILRKSNVERFSCVNRVELDRQHLADVDLMIAVGGDGTVLSAAHFLDHGTIPLLGINSDPNVTLEDRVVVKKTSDERRSHGALCMCTALDMEQALVDVLHYDPSNYDPVTTAGNTNVSASSSGGSGCYLHPLTRIRCEVKGTFSETRLVPALNDILIANPSPAAVSRFRMGWLKEIPTDHSSFLTSTSLAGATLTSDTTHESDSVRIQNHLSSRPMPSEGGHKTMYGTITRFGGVAYDVTDSINVWSSGMWICSSTGSTAAMKAAGGQVMDYNDTSLQYLIREHMIEHPPTVQRLPTPTSTDSSATASGLNNPNSSTNEKSALTSGNSFEQLHAHYNDINNGMIKDGEKLHIRWNSQRGRIFIDGSHLTHDLELGDEILFDNQAPPLKMFRKKFEVNSDDHLVNPSCI